MKKEALKRWLDKRVRIVKEDMATKCFDEIRDCFVKNYIQLDCGIEKVADMLGMELKEKPRSGDDEYPFQYYFEYQRVKVMELKEKRLERFADADREQNGTR